jgi:hypothetical protein
MDIVVSGRLIFGTLGSQHRMIGRFARPANACHGERIFLHNPRALQKYCKFSRRIAFLYRRAREFGRRSAPSKR